MGNRNIKLVQSDVLKTERIKATLNDLSKVLKVNQLSTKPMDLMSYSRDSWPIATRSFLYNKYFKTFANIIVWPENTKEVAEIVKIANKYKIDLIPYGAGSGVCGGTLPTKECIVLDLKRLNKIIEIDEVSNTVTSQVGILGIDLEKQLNKRNFTMGHSPQSLTCSTLGGYLACRSAGQFSTLYGKIEDMVINIEIVIPTGEIIETRKVPRTATGPGLMQFFIGSEGTLGVITKATMRIWPYPEKRKMVVISFPNLEDALDSIRTIMQKRLRPSVVRLFDEYESKSFMEPYPDYKGGPIILTMVFEGPINMVDFELKKSLDICGLYNGHRTGNEPGKHWWKHRYEARSAPYIYYQNKVLDTIEVSFTWDKAIPMYHKVKEAILKVIPDAHVGAHWSHVYPEGACMYITFVFPMKNLEQYENLNPKIWEAAVKTVISLGGTMSHHHGVGLIREKWMKDELGYGYEVLKKIKITLDPNNIMNTSKLGLGE